MATRLAVTLIKSPIGYKPAARATVRAIGLRRIHQTVVVSDTDAVRGMLASIPYLLRVENVENIHGGEEQPTQNYTVTSGGGVEPSQVSVEVQTKNGSKTSRSRTEKPAAEAAPESPKARSRSKTARATASSTVKAHDDGEARREGGATKPAETADAADSDATEPTEAPE